MKNAFPGKNPPRTTIVSMEGPPWVGKSALLEALLKRFWKLMAPVSFDTTNQKPPSTGNRYQVVSPKLFQQRLAQNAYFAIRHTADGNYGLRAPEQELAIGVLEHSDTEKLRVEAVRRSLSGWPVLTVLPVSLTASPRTLEARIHLDLKNQQLRWDRLQRLASMLASPPDDTSVLRLDTTERTPDQIANAVTRYIEALVALSEEELSYIRDRAQLSIHG